MPYAYYIHIHICIYTTYTHTLLIYMFIYIYIYQAVVAAGRGAVVLAYSADRRDRALMQPEWSLNTAAMQL